MLVINISTIVANVRYDFNRNGARFQFLYTQDAATSLPTSRDPAIIATGIAEAAKIAIRPATENHAAIAAITKAVMNTNNGKNIKISSGVYGPLHLYLSPKETMLCC